MGLTFNFEESLSLNRIIKADLLILRLSWSFFTFWFSLVF